MRTAAVLVFLTVAAPQDTLEDLFSTASLWQVGENVEKVRKAREDLIARGDAAVLFIVENKLGTRDGLEWRAIEDVILGVGASAIGPLQEKVRSGSLDEKRSAVSLLGALGSREDDPGAREMVLQGIRDIYATLETGYARLIATTFAALARLKPEGAYEAIRPFLLDESEILRKEAVVALGGLGDEDAVDDIRQVVIQGDFATRRPAGRALVMLDVLAAMDLFDHDDFRVRGIMAEAAGLVSHDARTCGHLVRLLEDPEPSVRAHAAEALGRMSTDPDLAGGALRRALGQEMHPFARWAMGKALERLQGE